MPLLFLVFLTQQLAAQIAFKPGYLITNKGVKKECLLKNAGIENSGKKYLYKYSSSDSVQWVDLKKVKEFGVYNKNRFIRSEIELDNSSNQIKHLKDTLNHQRLEKGYAFLQEVISSEHASLYSFLHEGNEYFFYKKKNSNIENLIFKKYVKQIASGLESEVYYDNRYQKQLELNLPCSAKTQRLSYSRRPLVRYFRTYIKENNGELQTETKKQEGKFLVKANAGVNFSSYSMEDKKKLSKHNFSNESGLTIGLTAEYLFPFNRNKWGLFAGVYYADITSYYTNSTNSGTNLPNSELELKDISIPFGIVHYIHFNKQFRFFLKGGVNASFYKGGKTFEIGEADKSDQLRDSAVNLIFGAGFNYGRFQAEASYFIPRNLISLTDIYDSEFNQLNITVGFTLFSH